MHNTPNTSLPHYGTKPEQPGLYLGLFHGRHDPEDQMIEWGFNGPLIGPLAFVHTTYTHNIKLGFTNEIDAKRFFSTQVHQMLTVSEDMVLFDSKIYGDWTVFYVGEDDCALPQDTFRDMPRRNSMAPQHQSKP
jgi:hypothetical protein